MTSLAPPRSAAPAALPVDAGTHYCVDGCHNGAPPVPRSDLDDEAEQGGLVMGIGLLVAAVETAVLLVML